MINLLCLYTVHDYNGVYLLPSRIDILSRKRNWLITFLSSDALCGSVATVKTLTFFSKARELTLGPEPSGHSRVPAALESPHGVCHAPRHGAPGPGTPTLSAHHGTGTHCNENPIYVVLFWELRGLSSNFHIHVYVTDLYIPRIGPHISCSKIGRSIVGI